MPRIFVMSNVCTCCDDDGQWLGECLGCWEDNLDYLNELVDCKGYWHVDAEQIGWRNYSGELTFEAENAEEWINHIVGFKCEWTFCISVISENKTSIVANVYHHDSPTGESRYIRRLTDEEWDKLTLEEYE